MLVQEDGTKLFTSFTDSVTTLLNDIKAESDRIDKEDPDPARTKSHMVNKKLREWFNRGGNLGY